MFGPQVLCGDRPRLAPAPMLIVIVTLLVLALQSFVTFTQNKLFEASGPVINVAESVPTGTDVSPAAPWYHWSERSGARCRDRDRRR